jgi:hypothetical protein
MEHLTPPSVGASFKKWSVVHPFKSHGLFPKLPKKKKKKKKPPGTNFCSIAAPVGPDSTAHRGEDRLRFHAIHFKLKENNLPVLIYVQ